jgi:hypothetical protein
MNAEQHTGRAVARNHQCIGFLLGMLLLLIACSDGSSTGLGKTTPLQIGGTVSDAATGLPLSEVYVELRRSNFKSSTLVSAARTDAQGRYSISHREERCSASLHVSASRTGYIAQSAGGLSGTRPRIQCVVVLQTYDFALEARNSSVQR